MPYYNKNYQNLPKKPVRTFHDLEVYQKALEAAVFIAVFIAGPYRQKTAAEIKKSKNKEEPAAVAPLGIKDEIMQNLVACALFLPPTIAAAHSFRFGSQKECLILLERAMLGCNKTVVYLDLARDICGTGISAEQFNELEEKYFFLRRKILNLQRSWQKYMGMPQGEKNMNNVNL